MGSRPSAVGVARRVEVVSLRTRAASVTRNRRGVAAPLPPHAVPAPTGGRLLAGTERVVEGAMIVEVMVVSPMPLGRGSSRQQGERHAEDEKSDEPLRVHSLPSGTIRAWSPYAPSGSRRQGDRVVSLMA